MKVEAVHKDDQNYSVLSLCSFVPQSAYLKNLLLPWTQRTPTGRRTHKISCQLLLWSLLELIHTFGHSLDKKCSQLLSLSLCLVCLQLARDSNQVQVFLLHFSQGYVMQSSIYF